MNQAEAPTHILTIKEVAAILRCSKAHVSKALSGTIPGVPRLTHLAVGRRKLIRREWLDEWLEANKKR
jgi:excisionase family DNA binding protein